MQFFHFRIEFFWQELDIVLVGSGLEQILKLRLHLDCEGTRHQIKQRLHLDREGTRHLEGSDGQCLQSGTVKEHDISKDRWPVSQPKFLTSAFQLARSQRDQSEKTNVVQSENVEVTCEMKRKCPSQSRCSQWLSPGNSPEANTK